MFVKNTIENLGLLTIIGRGCISAKDFISAEGTLSKAFCGAMLAQHAWTLYTSIDLISQGKIEGTVTLGGALGTATALYFLGPGTGFTGMLYAGLAGTCGNMIGKQITTMLVGNNTRQR